MNQILKLNDKVIFQYGRFWGIGIIAENNDYCPVIELIFVVTRISNSNPDIGWKPDHSHTIDKNYKPYNSFPYYLYVLQHDMTLLND